MNRCLYCNKEIKSTNKVEDESGWHSKCINHFFGTPKMPEINFTDSDLERLANLSVNKGLTVPGVQKKLSLRLDKEDMKTRLTIVDYPSGYILKPQSEDYTNLPEAEFMIMKMAERIKIQVVPNALVKLQNGYAYITKRIDRINNSQLAMEDFCQLSERMTFDKYRGSYEGCGKIIKKYSRNVGLDLTEFYYRLLFSFVTGNSDMHLKNFSLIEDEPSSRKYSLSAAYDMLPVNIILPEDNEQMALTLNGKKNNITFKDFIALADNLGISEKVAKNLTRQIIEYKNDYYEIIDQSYISDEMKEELKVLIEYRIIRLSSGLG